MNCHRQIQYLNETAFKQSKQPFKSTKISIVAALIFLIPFNNSTNLDFSNINHSYTSCKHIQIKPLMVPTHKPCWNSVVSVMVIIYGLKALWRLKGLEEINTSHTFNLSMYSLLSKNVYNIHVYLALRSCEARHLFHCISLYRGMPLKLS